MTNIEKVDAKIQYMIPRRIARTNKPPTILTSKTDDKTERWWFPKQVEKLSETDKNATSNLGVTLEEFDAK